MSRSLVALLACLALALSACLPDEDALDEGALDEGVLYETTTTTGHPVDGQHSPEALAGVSNDREIENPNGEAEQRRSSATTVSTPPRTAPAQAVNQTQRGYCAGTPFSSWREFGQTPPTHSDAARSRTPARSEPYSLVIEPGSGRELLGTPSDPRHLWVSGAIEISAGSPRSDLVRIQIADHGAGMTAGALPESQAVIVMRGAGDSELGCMGLGLDVSTGSVHETAPLTPQLPGGSYRYFVGIPELDGLEAVTIEVAGNEIDRFQRSANAPELTIHVDGTEVFWESSDADLDDVVVDVFFDDWEMHRYLLIGASGPHVAGLSNNARAWTVGTSVDLSLAGVDLSTGRILVVASDGLNLTAAQFYVA